MGYNSIIFEKRDGVAYITLNRPDDANALDLEMAEELHRTAMDCDQDAAVRAVLITGKGRMFCAGGDLKFFHTSEEGTEPLLMQVTMYFHRAISIFNRMDAPVVMAINGTAAGGGFSFAISGDVAFAAESAKFTLAYTAAGLSPDGSSTYLLPRFIGLRRAKELMLTNRVLSAAEAADYGIVDRVVADSELMAAAEAQARAFAAGPTQAYSAVKRLLEGTFKESLETQMELESRSISSLAAGRDGSEGIAAFAEKRKPDFTGEG
jgi:2-(1,2-epoxy-1,2-dihydrophenyl)acetyl-CoA isomerase